MACSSVLRSCGRRQPRAWAYVPAFAVLLLAICYPPAPLKAQQGEEAMSPAAHIARNRALIADAARLKLTPVQMGGLWAQMGSDYQDLGEFADAEAAYTRALSLLEPVTAGRKAYGITLGNLGLLYALTQRYDVAENCNKRSLAVMEELGDPLLIARAQGYLADVYLAMGRNKQALRHSSLAVKAFETLGSANSNEKGSILISYAYASCLTSHCEDGLKAAREAMKIVRASFAPESFPAGQAHVALGFIEGKTGEGEAADEDLREGIRILRLQLPPSHPLMLHALETYRDFLSDQHRDVEAKRIADEQKAATDRTCTQCTVSVHGLRVQ
ncbi:tetratricopeptide repeat protein [Edaphobacter aggregans]|uniref:tetratricopeptide repeat protein n=1 Tax=Edaphobacter aggregans TaxID=570835 RepID=UPI000A00AFC1|nr:tetratricopeptide repeat protein [Edaphobacter aggregans]